MTLELGWKFPALDQELPEPSARSAQPRLDGPEGHALSLGGLGSVLGMPERAQGHVVDGRLVAQHELVEGARVAALRCLQRSRLGDATVGDGGHERRLALPRNRRDRRSLPTNYTTPRHEQ